MSDVTIDKLSIEITSNSTGAAQGIDALAASLGKLKANGSVGVAVKNLNNLSEALRKLNSVTSSAANLNTLADSVSKLSNVGSMTKVINQLNKLPDAVKRLSEIDEGSFSRFASQVEKLNNTLTPLSTKMTTIQQGMRGITTSAKSAGAGVKEFGTKVNTTTLNLASLITVIQGVKAALMPLVLLFSNAMGQAMEWDSISYQFGNAFGEQADEYYQKITEITDALQINKQTFMESSAMAASMLKGFGVNSSDAREMGLGYTELAYDIWAAYNNVYKTLEGADGAMAAVRSAIAGEVEPIRRAGFTIVDSQLKITAANHGLTYSTEKATEAQKSYLRYLTLVDQAETKGILGTYAYEMKMNTAEALTRTLTQQTRSLAQAFGSLFLPILVKVMPWLQAFVNLLTEAVYKVAAFFGIDIQPATWSDGIGGITEGAENATDSLGGTADAVDATTDALKDLKKATIGIDELNVISPPTANKGSGGSGGDGGSPGWDGLDVGSIWDESIYGSIQFEADRIKSLLEDSLTQVTAIISGFMLAIGTILVVSGANIPLGLGLMAVGAVGLVGVIAENWNSMSDQLAKTLTVVTAVLGGFLLAIGAFLAFSGVNVGLGIALMAAGAVSLATAATINWKFLNGDMENTLSILTGIVSGGLLAMGALFAFTGVAVPLGIGLMVAGAVGLATSVGLNWDSMSEPMRKAIGTLEMIIASALISFGAILAFSGANIPLGIGLIAAGAVSMVAAEQLNWGSLNGEMKNRIATLTALISGAALGLGAVLTFTGVATGVGIALLAAGAAGIISSAAVNWNYITDKVKTVLKEIGIAAGASLIALGVLLVCTGVGVPVGMALIAAGAASLVSGVALNWDSIVTEVKGALGKVETAWNDLVTKVKNFKAVQIAVSLFKSGWATVKGWIGNIPTLSQLIKLGKSGWTSVKSWIGSIPAVSQAVKLAKSGWSSVKGWIGSIPTLSAGIKLVKSGWTTVKKWLGSLNFDIGFKLPKIGINWGSKEVLGFKISYPKSFYTYAKGGFPDMGEMFIAREAGPEMVGKIGNKTTVANNEQIVEAVSEGVYAAVLAAMRQSEGNGGQAVNVYLDGRQITSAVEKRQRERGTSIVGKQLYAY